MDRDRVFYPTMLIASVSYYLAFAVVDGGTPVLVAAAVLCTAFTGTAVPAFKRNLRLVVGAR